MQMRTKRMAFATGVLLVAGAASNAWSAENMKAVMDRRGLTEKDLLAAAKTYTPTGGRDEYLAFSSGGQSGQVSVYGIPSMRILKYIGGRLYRRECASCHGSDGMGKVEQALPMIAGQYTSYLWRQVDKYLRRERIHDKDDPDDELLATFSPMSRR